MNIRESNSTRMGGGQSEFYNLWSNLLQTRSGSDFSGNKTETNIRTEKPIASFEVKNPDAEDAALVKSKLPEKAGREDDLEIPGKDESKSGEIKSDAEIASKLTGDPSVIKSIIQFSLNRLSEEGKLNPQIASKSGNIIKVEFGLPGSSVKGKAGEGILSAESNAKSIQKNVPQPQGVKGELFFKFTAEEGWQAVTEPAEIEQALKGKISKAMPQLKIEIQPVAKQAEKTTGLTGSEEEFQPGQKTVLKDGAPSEVSQQGKATEFLSLRLKLPQSARSAAGAAHVEKGQVNAANNASRNQVSASGEGNAEVKQFLKLTYFVKSVQETGAEALQTNIQADGKVITTQDATNLNIQNINSDKSPQTLLFKDQKFLKIESLTRLSQEANGLNLQNHAAKVFQIKSQNVSPVMIKLADEIQQMIEQIKNVQQKRTGDLQLRFENTPLGKIDLHFQQKENKVTVYVESEQVRSELLKLSSAIQNNLVQKGIVIGGFQVNVGQFKSSSQHENGTQRRKIKTSDNIISGKEGSSYEPNTTIISRNFGYNTMEITA
ncbi:MAG: flagellar hook-length control protein FliK [Calditrichaeota bacterium]|nr:flagellar hook-length control protein FliK [Calditrichota bacterium]